MIKIVDSLQSEKIKDSGKVAKFQSGKGAEWERQGDEKTGSRQWVKEKRQWQSGRVAKFQSVNFELLAI